MKRAHNNLQQIGPVLIAKTVFECLHYQSATVAPIIKSAAIAPTQPSLHGNHGDGNHGDLPETRQKKKFY